MQIKKLNNFETDIQFPIVKCLMTIPPERMSILETRLKEQWKGELSISHSQRLPKVKTIATINISKLPIIATL